MLPLKVAVVLIHLTLLLLGHVLTGIRPGHAEVGDLGLGHGVLGAGVELVAAARGALEVGVAEVVGHGAGVLLQCARGGGQGAGDAGARDGAAERGGVRMQQAQMHPWGGHGGDLIRRAGGAMGSQVAL